MALYKIVRLYFDDSKRPQTVATHKSLEEARAWCHDPETSSSTCTEKKGLKRTEKYGAWFDSYSEM
jgi:hypothetical protein